ATVLLLTMAFVIDGSLTVFVDRLMLGASDAAALGGRHTMTGIFRLDPLTWDPETRRLFWLVVLGSAAGSLLILARSVSTLASWAGSLLLAGALLLAMTRPFLTWTSSRPLLVAAVPVGVALSLVARRAISRQATEHARTMQGRRFWTVPVLVALLPACA